MNTPKIDPEMLKNSQEICQRKEKETKKKALKNWISLLAGNIIAILALIVGIVSVVISVLQK